MSLALEIKLVEDTARPAVAALSRFVSSSRLQETVALSAQRTIRNHLLVLNSSRGNSLGGSRTNFYQRAANGTSWTPEGDNAVVISIASVGIAQRFYGGTIKPKAGKKYLTIPARSEAYGRSARSFNDLVVLFGKNGPYALARAAQSRIGFSRRSGATSVRKLGAAGGEVLFWLVAEVTQQPDPTVLPNDNQIASQINRDVQAALDLEIARAQQRSGNGGAS